MERMGEATLMEIRKEAAAWLVEMDAEPERWDRGRFAGWLKLSPHHMEEFLDQYALWVALREGDPESIDVRRLLEDAGNIVNWPQSGQSSPPQCARATKRRWWLAGGLAATLILASGAWLSQALFLSDTTVLTTAIGEQRAVQLPDRSVMHLNTNTRAEIRFIENVREVRLIQGEALFTVERDPRRPFRVLANDIQVEAIGTEFNVHQRASDTLVAVVEGSVALIAAEPSDVLSSDETAASRLTDTPVGSESDRTTPPDMPSSVPEGRSLNPRAGTLAVLKAGEQVRVAQDGALERPTVTNVAAATAWRQRQLVFSNTPLSEVAAEVARYNIAPRLQIEGEARQIRRLDGVFRADDPESLIQFLARDADLVIIRSGDTVTIRSR